jgi:hypothetical protein
MPQTSWLCYGILIAGSLEADGPADLQMAEDRTNEQLTRSIADHGLLGVDCVFFLTHLTYSLN